jgi:Kae1-associated kinase Bud32
LYFINWERKITRTKVGNNIVVVKQNTSFTSLRQFILIFCFTLISICFGNPANPPEIGKRILQNESFESRNKLKLIGINCPKLFSITDKEIIEEYIAGGNLYSFFTTEKANDLAFEVGKITGKLHKNGLVFIDNKCQNFLVTKKREVIRIDLGFIQKSDSVFAQSMDIGSFLASILDLEPQIYKLIEKEFLIGYIRMTNKKIPYLSIILRNILALGFVYSHKNMLKNMLNKPCA